MTALNYLSEFDKVTAYHRYRHIIADMSRHQLEFALLMILNGGELEYALDIAMTLPKDI